MNSFHLVEACMNLGNYKQETQEAKKPPCQLPITSTAPACLVNPARLLEARRMPHLRLASTTLQRESEQACVYSHSVDPVTLSACFQNAVNVYLNGVFPHIRAVLWCAWPAALWGCSPVGKLFMLGSKFVCHAVAVCGIKAIRYDVLQRNKLMSYCSIPRAEFRGHPPGILTRLSSIGVEYCLQACS